jgi:predicted kinase
MELVLFIGLQASGKTSFYRSRFAPTHTHVSKDRLRNNRNRDRRQLELVRAALEAGQSVVVDNTNPMIADRRPLIDLARSFGAKVTGYYFESRVADCVARNQTREGANRVPDVALYSTIKKLEHPCRAEGFDDLFHVRLAPKGDFEVTPWRDDEADHEGC